MKVSKHLTKVKDFYKANGLIGVTSKRLKSMTSNFFEIRAGASSLPSAPLVELGKKKIGTRSVRQKVEDILADDKISPTEKEPFSSLYEEQYDPYMSGDFESRRRFWESRNTDFENDPAFQKLKDCLIAKSHHPVYSQIKSKLPTAMFLPLTSCELKRLAAYRMLGFSSAPFTIASYLGITLPCAVTFSMLEMYLPDKFKLPCKVAKWTGGGLYYGVSYTLDHLTKPVEKKYFGIELPIDAQQTMGTIPTTSDMSELYEWSKEFMKKTN